MGRGGASRPTPGLQVVWFLQPFFFGAFLCLWLHWLNHLSAQTHFGSSPPSSMGPRGGASCPPSSVGPRGGWVGLVTHVSGPPRGRCWETELMGSSVCERRHTLAYAPSLRPIPFRWGGLLGGGCQPDIVGGGAVGVVCPGPPLPHHPSLIGGRRRAEGEWECVWEVDWDGAGGWMRRVRSGG